MANTVLAKGLEGFLDGSVDLDTDTIKLMLSDGVTTDVAIKAVTAASNATPIVVTCTSHGFANGDTVVIESVGGNTAANNVWVVANQAANTFELTGSTGNGAYTSGGIAICLGPSAAGQTIDDFSAGVVGTDATLGSKTVTSGVFDAADATYTALTGSAVRHLYAYKDTGTPSTSRVVYFSDAKTKVVAAATAASSATTIVVEPLQAPIASGASAVFSNGATATLSANAAEGARSITVSSLAAQVTAGAWASYAASTAAFAASGFPFTPNGGDLTVVFPASGIFRI